MKRMLAEAQEEDAREDKAYGKERRGDELPEDLRKRRGRLARLKESRERLAREAAERAAEQARKIEERKKQEELTGQDGAESADETRKGIVQATWSGHRAGVWADQGWSPPRRIRCGGEDVTGSCNGDARPLVVSGG